MFVFPNFRKWISKASLTNVEIFVSCRILYIIYIYICFNEHHNLLSKDPFLEGLITEFFFPRWLLLVGSLLFCLSLAAGVGDVGAHVFLDGLAKATTGVRGLGVVCWEGSSFSVSEVRWDSSTGAWLTIWSGLGNQKEVSHEHQWAFRTHVAKTILQYWTSFFWSCWFNGWLVVSVCFLFSRVGCLLSTKTGDTCSTPFQIWFPTGFAGGEMQLLGANQYWDFWPWFLKSNGSCWATQRGCSQFDGSTVP